MTPKTINFKSTLNFKFPTYRNLKWQGAHEWLDGKRVDDDTGGLWRVHDDLYDLTDFVDKHPGGKLWLEVTKGTDVTEAFEVHHFTDAPEIILSKHFIRKASHRRNSPFTFHNDGFYKSLKRNIKPILKDVPKASTRATDNLMDFLAVATIVVAILANVYWSYMLGIIAGYLISCTAIGAHNYFHRKDNFRMFYFNLSMMQFQEWRITHVLCHHLFPNTIIDHDLSYLEPFIEYLPKKKTLMQKYGCRIYIGLLWMTSALNEYMNRFTQFILSGETRQLYWSDSIPLFIPFMMTLFAEHSIFWTIWMWMFIIAMGSLGFEIAGNTTHHSLEIFYDGDTPRSENGIDWGIHQLDTVADRHGVIGTLFFVLTGFGDHGLHHLFPTIDHGTLKYFYPVLKQTMKEFNVDLRVRSYYDMIKGLFEQLAREEFNPIPPQ